MSLVRGQRKRYSAVACAKYAHQFLPGDVVNLSNACEIPSVAVVVNTDVAPLIKNDVTRLGSDVGIVLWQFDTDISHFLEVSIVVGLVSDGALCKLLQQGCG